jgi:hypothetical protein
LERDRGHDEPDGVGHVAELEPVRLAQVVTVDLVRERRVVLDDEVAHVDVLVEVAAGLHATTAERGTE